MRRALTILGLGVLCAAIVSVVIGLATGDSGTAGTTGAVLMFVCGGIIAADGMRRQERGSRSS